MDYGDDYDFSDWFSDDYGSDYIPMEGNTTPDSGDYFDNAGGTFGDWSDGNYDYTYGNTSDYGNDYYNNINYGNGGNIDYSGSGNFYGNSPQFQAIDTANPFGSISQTLAGLFNNPQALGMAGKGVAALFEGYQNKKKAEAMQKLAKNPALDPFGSQRQFYQQQAQQAVTNPYYSPIVKAQIEQLQNAQNIKDAQAGRRSNMLTSSPAVMAEMAKIAQNYQQQMAVQGGANISPSGGLAQILQSGATADVNGYLSPLMAMLGNTTQAQKNAAAMG